VHPNREPSNRQIWTPEGLHNEDALHGMGLIFRAGKAEG